MPPSELISEAAIDWSLRLRDAAATGDDWAAFTAWLEADPAHAAAYDFVALVDADAADLAGRVQPLRRPRPIWAGRRAGLAAAAAIAAAVAVVTPALISRSGAPEQVVSTGPGERRVVDLADGTRISLNGSTRVELGVRTAVLTAGEALFDVRHDPQRPFEVIAGETRLRDLGTVFNVKRLPGATEVAVAAGAVVADPDGAAVRLRPGDRLRDADGPGNLELSRLSPTTVGGWREGRLSFHDASLSEVAADLTRGTGVRIAADPRIAARVFTGTIVVDADTATLRRRLAPLLGVGVTGDGRNWTLVPPPREPA